MANRTPWIPVSKKPVRTGLYEYMFKGSSIVIKTYWNGRDWDDGWSPRGTVRGDQWRGLANKPKEYRNG